MHAGTKAMQHRGGKYMGAFRGHRNGAGMMGSTLITAAAKYLGVTTAQLESDLKSGKTLADVANTEAATNSNISVTGLEAALVSAVTARVTTAVDSFVTNGMPRRGKTSLRSRRGGRRWSQKSGSSSSGSSSTTSSSSGSSTSSSSSSNG